MSIRSLARISYFRAVLFLSIASLLSSCAEESTIDAGTVVIHAGPAEKAYSRFVELLNDRVSDLKTSYTGCKDDSGTCPSIANFEFTTACSNGGSQSNLARIGLQPRSVRYFRQEERTLTAAEAQQDGEADTVVETIDITEEIERGGLAAQPGSPVFTDPATCGANANSDSSQSMTDALALVQNYFISAAAQTYCRENVCEPFAIEQTVGGITRRIEYQNFEDLRIVLPLYNSIVQFVTIQEVDDAGAPVGRTELEDLENAVVYLQGVNDTYGREVLNRHPRLLTAFPRVLTAADFASESQFETTLRELGALNYLTQRQQNALWAFYSSAENPDEGNDRLLACGILDAYAISGTIIDDGRVVSFDINPAIIGDLPPECLRNYQLQQIQIPERIIDSMVADHPFYQKLDPPGSWGETHISAVPGLITYLAANANADDSLIEADTAAIHDDWDNLMLLDPKLSDIRDNVLKKPAPYHDGAELALNERDLLGAGFSFFSLATWLTIVVGVITLNYVWRSRFGYDRLGEHQELGFNTLFGQGFVDFGIIMLGWAWVFMMVITAIRLSDAAIASTQNADDQLSALGFVDTLIWMITFIASGYDDDVFPTSTFSRMVLSGFTILGIAYPLYLIAAAWDRMRTKRLNRARGGELRSLWRYLVDWWLDQWPWTYRSKGTLLICGWNSRGPGLIYTLTCHDSPFAGTVNILADPDVEYPVNYFNFNKSRVRFYRGDSSHRSHLERAEVLRAESVLILTDESAGPENSSGVLTALAIERLKPDMPVFAEMAMNKGSRDFTEQHMDSVFDPRVIAWQMISIGAFDNYVLDFALDALSPDDRYEWYSKEAGALKALLPKGRPIASVGDLSGSLQKIGISVIGVCKQSSRSKDKRLSVKDFKNDDSLNPLISMQSLQEPISDTDYIICAAESPSSFNPLLGKRFGFGENETDVEFHVSSEAIIRSSEQSASVLIIGHEDQAVAVSGQIRSTLGAKYYIDTDSIEIETISTDNLGRKELNATIIDSLANNDWSHIILLSSIPAERGVGEFDLLAMRADSDTIMRANFIRVELAKLQKESILIAEVNKTHNRQLAKDADVTTVVPSSLLIERLLARMVSGKGWVTEMLGAMLSMKDETFLRSYKLTAGHPLVGQPYGVVMNTWFADGRVLGILPIGSSLVDESWKNNSDDFDWHFCMCPTREEQGRKLCEEDVLIVLVCPPSTVS